jgi:hypothetical protein
MVATPSESAPDPSVVLPDRTVTDPVGVTPAGPVTVTLPVAERAKPRRIEVAAADDAQTIDSGADQGAIAS